MKATLMEKEALLEEANRKNSQLEREKDMLECGYPRDKCVSSERPESSVKKATHTLYRHLTMYVTSYGVNK